MPGRASAHAARIATDPAENAELATGPQRVSATFNEAMQTEFAAMTVVGPDGNLWSTGDPAGAGAVVSVGVRPLGPSGTYTVNYRVTSADGHRCRGRGRSGSTGGHRHAGPVGRGNPPSPPDGGAIPVWPFLVAGAVIIGGGDAVGGAAPGVTRARGRWPGRAVVVGAAAAAWALAYPQNRCRDRWCGRSPTVRPS